jgi:ATP-dependent DNA ligase
MLAKAGPGIRFNEHMEGDGPTVFAHACKLGMEGIIEAKNLQQRLKEIGRMDGATAKAT